MRRDLAVFGFAALWAPAAVRDVAEDRPVEGCAVGAGLGAGEDLGEAVHCAALHGVTTADYWAL